MKASIPAFLLDAGCHANLCRRHPLCRVLWGSAPAVHTSTFQKRAASRPRNVHIQAPSMTQCVTDVRISVERRVPAGRATRVAPAQSFACSRKFQLDRRVIRSVRGSDPWVACVARSRELMLKGIDLLQPGGFKTPGGLLRGPADSSAPHIPPGHLHPEYSGMFAVRLYVLDICALIRLLICVLCPCLCVCSRVLRA